MNAHLSTLVWFGTPGNIGPSELAKQLFQSAADLPGLMQEKIHRLQRISGKGTQVLLAMEDGVVIGKLCASLSRGSEATHGRIFEIIIRDDDNSGLLRKAMIEEAEGRLKVRRSGSKRVTLSRIQIDDPVNINIAPNNTELYKELGYYERGKDSGLFEKHIAWSANT